MSYNKFNNVIIITFGREYGPYTSKGCKMEYFQNEASNTNQWESEVEVVLKGDGTTSS
jgi:hypothetical protein